MPRPRTQKRTYEEMSPDSTEISPATEDRTPEQPTHTVEVKDTAYVAK